MCMRDLVPACKAFTCLVCVRLMCMHALYVYAICVCETMRVRAQCHYCTPHASDGAHTHTHTHTHTHAHTHTEMMLDWLGIHTNASAADDCVVSGRYFAVQVHGVRGSSPHPNFLCPPAASLSLCLPPALFLSHPACFCFSPFVRVGANSHRGTTPARTTAAWPGTLPQVLSLSLHPPLLSPSSLPTTRPSFLRSLYPRFSRVTWPSAEIRIDMWHGRSASKGPNASCR